VGQAARRWVVLDIGEVLIEETRVWDTWAKLVGLPPFTLMAAIGGAVTGGGDHRDAFEALGVADWADRTDEFDDLYGAFRSDDLYPDVLPALTALRVAGYRIAVIGNQPARRSAELRALDVDVDVLAMSDELGVEKPDRRFFERVLQLVGAEAGDVAYVGDRVDNDVLPALAAGLRPVWLRRGPWGALHRLPDGVAVPQARSLDELPALIGGEWEGFAADAGG
jgi:HAD superfamily hydrolase (TIGR01662 family)